MKKKKVWIIAIIVVVLGIIVISSSSSDKKAVTTKSTDNKAVAVATPQDKVNKVGDIVNIDGMKLKVDKVSYADGTEYDSLKKGDNFVIVKVTITNDSDQTISYNALDYSLKNSKGNITTETVRFDGQNEELNSGELAKGGTVTGNLTFEAPKGDKNLALLYKGNMFDTEADVSISLN